MNTTDNHKLSKVETRNLLRHATAQSSTREVAQLAGVADSRISEGKEGKWLLNIEQAKKIRAQYGEPRAAAGLFVYGELWQSVDELIKYTTEVSKWRQWKRIVAVINHSNFEKQIDETIYLNHQDSNKKQHKIAVLQAMIDDSDFSDWFAISKERLQEKVKYPYCDDWNEAALQAVAEKNGFSFDLYQARYDSGLAAFLLLFGSIKEQEAVIYTKTECPIGNPFNFQEKHLLLQLPEEIIYPATEREMVVAGDIVWDDVLHIENILRQEGMLQLGIYHESLKNYNPRIFSALPLSTIYPDEFKYVAIRVILTKELNYHMVVNLESSERMRLAYYENENKYPISLNCNMEGSSEIKRLMVVRNIRDTELFSNILKVYDWLGLKQPNLFWLKEKIAEQGGYVPGAIYLE